jgi:hypothetical protein
VTHFDFYIGSEVKYFILYLYDSLLAGGSNEIVTFYPLGGVALVNYPRQHQSTITYRAYQGQAKGAFLSNSARRL